MKNLISMILALVLVLTLAACGVDAPDPTTHPTNAPATVPTNEPTTEPVTEPTAEPATEPDTEPTEQPTELVVSNGYPALPDASAERRMLTDQELADFITMFNWTVSGDNWYNYALKSEYVSPADLDLLEFFYSAPIEELTQEDLDFYGEAASAIHKYSVSRMNEVLNTYFGIGFDETNGIGLDQMVYNEEAQCYYHEHGDLMESFHSIFEGYVNPDSTVELYYIDLIDSVDEDVIKVVTLKYVDQGNDAPCWQIVSNVSVTE